MTTCSLIWLHQLPIPFFPPLSLGKVAKEPENKVGQPQGPAQGFGKLERKPDSLLTVWQENRFRVYPCGGREGSRSSSSHPPPPCWAAGRALPVYSLAPPTSVLSGIPSPQSSPGILGKI